MNRLFKKLLNYALKKRGYMLCHICEEAICETHLGLCLPCDQHYHAEVYPMSPAEIHAERMELEY